jgi:hypothetical protein
MSADRSSPLQKRGLDKEGETEKHRERGQLISHLHIKNIKVTRGESDAVILQIQIEEILF